MSSRISFSRKSLVVTTLTLLVLFLLFFVLHVLIAETRIIPRALSHLKENSGTDALKLNPPIDYVNQNSDSETCGERLGLEYLENLRDHRAQYCSPNSTSQLMCFHSQTALDGRIDSFCVGKNAVFNLHLRKFELNCENIEPREVESNRTAPSLGQFPTYMYTTGARHILDEFINLETRLEHIPTSDTITVLIKREGASNLWHSLMEIMSATMTMDVLQMNRSEGNVNSIIGTEDVSKTQVVILDSHPNGPYVDLWRLVGGMPIARFSDLAPDFNSSLVIVPLPGGSNPIWQGDWEPNDCQHSDLLATFSRRVRRHFNITDPIGLPEQIVVTFINRTDTRKLIDQDSHFEAIGKRYNHTEILLQVIDFAALPLEEQIEIVRGTDILVGVHGAGLTHGIWLNQGSTMVEILPHGFNHKGFRNLAGALGHNYYSAHASEPETSVQDNSENFWQVSDVALEESRFLYLLDIAIKSMYNKGRHNLDVVK